MPPVDPAQAMPLDRHTAWLIERGQPEGQVPTVWLAPGGRWTTDANEALQFSDKTRALAHVAPDRRLGRVTEHIFLDPSDPITERGVPEPKEHYTCPTCYQVWTLQGDQPTHRPECFALQGPLDDHAVE